MAPPKNHNSTSGETENLLAGVQRINELFTYAAGNSDLAEQQQSREEMLNKERQLNIFRPIFGIFVGVICVISYILGIDMIYCAEYEHCKDKLKGTEFVVAMTFLGGICGMAGHILKGLFR